MSDHDPITRPARLALSIPDSGSSGIIDVADLRADPPPLSLSPPEGSSPTARHAASRWPLVGVLSAAAASLTMVALAAIARPAPTVVVQQPTAPLAPELAMHEAPQPEVRTAVEHEQHEATRRRPTRAKASKDDASKSSEPAEETTTEPVPSTSTSPSKATASRTKSPRSTSKRSASSKSTTKPEASPPSSIAIECVLDPSRCTASGTPKTATGSSSSTSTKAPPAKLSASQLKAALASTKADARRCGTQHGADPGTRVQVKLSIEGSSGRVVSATPQGDHASGSLGRCVAQALSQTQFPRFGSARMGTLYSVRM